MSPSQLVPAQNRVALPAAPSRNGAGGPPSLRPEATQDALDLREIVRLLRRHLLLIAVTVAVTTGLAGYLAYTQPPRYESRATIRMIDVRRALTGGLGGEGGIEQRVGIGQADPLLSQIQVLRSRSVLGRAVDRVGLRLRPLGRERIMPLLSGVAVTADAPSDTLRLRFNAAGVEVTAGRVRAQAAYGAPVSVGGVQFTVDRRPGFDEARLAVLPRDRAIEALNAGLSTRPRERTDIVDMEYTAGDPELARRVLDGLVEEFQATSVAQSQQQSRRRRQFIEEQLRETDSQLAEAQLALSVFRTGQQGYSSREKSEAEQTGLMSLELRREELEAERQLGRTLLTRLERGADDGALRALVGSPSIAANPVVSQLYAQLVRYEETRDSLTTGAYRSAANSPDVQRVNSLVAGTRARIADAVRSQLASLDARIAAVDNLLSRRQDRMQALPGVEAQEVRLAQQVSTTQTVADQLRTELQKARIAEAVEAGQVEVVDRASLPASPIPNRRGMRLGFGLVLGLLLGGGIAFVREQVNTTIRRREELDELLQLSSLAVIPRVDGTSGNGNGRRSRLSRGRAAQPVVAAGPGLDERLVAVHNVRSSGADAYRTLRTNLIFSQAHQALRLIVVTSAGPAEGKTTTACNLAATFAQQGVRVVLVDCDLRRPRVHEVFSTPREPGLTQLMLGHVSLEEATRATPVDNLSVLPSGTLPPNPSELLGSERMQAVLEQLRGAYDLVVLDSPPVLLAPDASIVGAGADGVLLVVRAGVTDRGAVRQTAQQLETVGARLLGAVLNDPDAKLPRYSGYYGTTYYGRDE